MDLTPVNHVESLPHLGRLLRLSLLGTEQRVASYCPAGASETIIERRIREESTRRIQEKMFQLNMTNAAASA
jgi:hypothetical protein